MNIKLFLPSIMLVVVTTVSSPAFAQSQTQPQTQNSEKINSIKELISITDAKNVTQQILNQSVDAMKSQFPQVPQKFWNEFKAGANADELINRLIPIYNKYFTEEDIKQLITFYQTPLGKKLISVNPQVARDSLIVGQQYGKEVAQTVIEKLKEQGYLR
ncbi:MAG: DUF2059 domain-containing protein [Gloeocapsa sp. UFS-A4-WI-NPMV-4B04]|nr:DUF2059 domain-containing protein [Gloeocapsa sp. UFS-A4-WI-NPMV-4B04]